MRHSTRWLLLLCLLCPAASAQTVYVDFEGIADGTTAEALNLAGIRFDPSPDGSWMIAPAFFTGLRGQMLFQPTTTGSLDIILSSPATSISFDFAQNSETVGETALVVQALRGTSSVGSTRQRTTFIGEFYAEGAVSFAASSPFDRIRISSDPVTLIAIDNISVPAGQIPNETPIEATFTVVPSAIALGQEATLSWSVPGATGVTIDNGIGSQPAAGSIVVQPNQSTTYTLNAQVANQSVTLQARIEVIAAPALALTAAPRGMNQVENTAGAVDSFVVTNVGGGNASVTLQPQGSFFTLAASSFTLAPGASQTVTLTGRAQAAGAYQGSVTVRASGVSETIEVPVRLVSAPRPSGRVVPSAASPRLDLSSTGSSSVTGSVTFRNTGTGTLRGVAHSDQPWVTPEGGLITIAAGQSRAVSFTVDPTKRASDVGSEKAEISLVYVPGTEVGASRISSNHTTTQSVSVSLVHTRTPSVTGGAIPALTAAEAASFLPGVVRRSTVVSDVVALLRRSSPSPASVNMFYLPASLAPSAARVASFPGVSPSAMLPLADVVKSVFNDPATFGTVQVRSPRTHPVAVSGKVFSVARSEGLFGTSLSSFRSDRGVSASQLIVLPGISRAGQATATDLFLQEVSGIATTVRTDFLGAAGNVILSRTDPLDAFTMRELVGVVPDGAVTAVVTNTGVGRVVARALMTDTASSDITDIIDWTVQNGIGANDDHIIPLVRTDSSATSLATIELMIANRGPETLRGTLSAFVPQPSRRRAARRGSTSGPTATHAIPASTRWARRAAAELIAVPQATTTIEVPAGQTRVMNSALAELGAGGASHLVFSPTGGTASITARMRSTTPRNEVFTTNLPVVSRAAGLTLAQTKEFGAVDAAGRTTVDKKQPGSFVSSLTLVETAGEAAVVRVTLQFTDAVTSGLASLRGSAKKDYVLRAGGLLHIADVARDIIGNSRDQFDDLRNMQLDVLVVSGGGTVVPILTERETGTGDLIVRME